MGIDFLSPLYTEGCEQATHLFRIGAGPGTMVSASIFAANGTPLAYFGVPDAGFLLEIISKPDWLLTCSLLINLRDMQTDETGFEVLISRLDEAEDKTPFIVASHAGLPFAAAMLGEAQVTAIEGIIRIAAGAADSRGLH